ncbi:MAG: amidohydrolase family protein, partial [Clostridia bacterium]|nr:amidohydrolase family protein [Clostridia bacterium]
ILIHAGDNRYDFSNPNRLLNLSKKFPKLLVIAAHFGGYSCWQEYFEILCETNFYFDTSSSLFSIDYNLAKAIINKKGEDYIMFGTDFPMWRFEDEIKRFERLKLSDSLNEKILFKNAEMFLKLL